MRVSTAIEVIQIGDHQAPGLRHWTPHLWASPGSHAGPGQYAACGSSIAGCVLTSGTINDVSCEDCLIAYVRDGLLIDRDDLEIGR